MNKCELLEEKALEQGIQVVSYPFKSNRIKGLYCDGTIALNTNINDTSEKACILAEELGHYYTTVGDILDQSNIQNRKQELQARVWAYSHMITMEMLLECKRRGCRNRYEIAEYLGVTEEFLQNALDRYKSIYGVAHQKDGYLITFDPFDIYEVCD